MFDLGFEADTDIHILELHMRYDQHIRLGSTFRRRGHHRAASNTSSRYQLQPFLRAPAVARVSDLPGSKHVMPAAQCFYYSKNYVAV